MQIIFAFLLILLYIFLYITFGQAFLSLFKIKTKSLLFTALIGFFVYYAAFQIVALPLKIFLRPLLQLSVMWIIVSVTIVLITLLLSRRELGEKFKHFKTEISNNRLAFLLIFAIVAFQLIVIELNWFPGSGWDISFYVGEVTSSLYSNTIEQYDVYTGQKLMYLNPSYLLENYEMHSAVICQITGIHPLLEMKTIMTAIIVLISNGIVFKIASAFFKTGYYKVAIMMLLVMVVNLTNVSFYSPSSFFFNRTFEGKTILSCVILYMVLYLLIRFALDKRDKGIWASLFVVNFAAFCINGSSVFVLSIAMLAFFVPAIIAKRKMKCFINFAICMLPCVAMVIITYMLKFGLISIEV